MDFVYDAPVEELQNPFFRGHTTGKGRIEDHYLLSPEAYSYLEERLARYPKEARVLVVHTMMSADPKRGKWVSLPARVVRNYSRTAHDQLPRLLSDGHLERDAVFGKGKSYRYRVSQEFETEILKAEVFSESGRRIVVGTGKRSRRVPPGSKLRDHNGNSYKEPILAALRALREGAYNHRRVVKHVRELLEASESAEAMGQSGAPRAKARFETDARCLIELRNQGLGSGGPMAQKYRLRYRVVSTGRLSQIGGGLQSCTRKMKSAAYEGLDVFNYDIRSSQAHILQSEMNKAGFRSDWLDTYLENPKGDYAARVGISVGTWKRCLYAIIFGAALGFSKGLRGDDRALREALIEEVGRKELRLAPGEVEAKAKEAFGRFKTEVGSLHRTLNKWRRYLVDVWLPKKAVNSGKGWSVRNDAGALLNRDRYIRWDKPGVQRAKLASFVLQGIESGFIHELTSMLSEYEVVPISNEHDGLVTLSQIPDEAIRRVQKRRQMPFLRLEIKPIG